MFFITRIVTGIIAFSITFAMWSPLSAQIMDSDIDPHITSHMASGELADTAFGANGMDEMRTLSEAELSTARGGFGGVYFTLLGYGDYNGAAGQLPEGATIASQSAESVSLNLGLATLPNTGGFVQFASVVGNNNIINNNLILNVYFLEGGVADTSSIANGSAFGF